MHIAVYMKVNVPDKHEIERRAYEQTEGSVYYVHSLPLPPPHSIMEFLDEDNWYSEQFLLLPDGTLVISEEDLSTASELVEELKQLPPSDRWRRLQSHLDAEVLTILSEQVVSKTDVEQRSIDAIVRALCNKVSELSSQDRPPVYEIHHLSEMLLSLRQIRVFPFSTEWSAFYEWPFLDIGHNDDHYAIAVYDIHV